MRISKIHLCNFKRFTDLTISEIPESSKLVLVIGSNGSGKSCLFDAFDWLGKGHAGIYVGSEEGDDAPYYKKEMHINTSALVEFTNNEFIKKMHPQFTTHRISKTPATANYLKNL